jgi:hypothetical protein
MRAVLSAAALLLVAPLSVVAQEAHDSNTVCSCSGGVRKPNVFFFGRSRGEGPAIGVETTSGSIRDTLGVLVIGVTNNGPADKAGIEEGDRIATANGVDLRLAAADAGDREMRGLMARRLARAVEKVKVGDGIELRVWHNGAYRTVKVTTVKASDLAMDDDGFGPVEFGPAGQVRIERMPGMPMPDVRAFQPLIDAGSEQIRIQLRDLQPLLDGMPPLETLDYGVHRM